MPGLTADCIYIVAETAGLAQEIKSSITLRGFDRVKAHSFEEGARALQQELPDLLILDGGGGQGKRALDWLKTYADNIPAIFLADRFEEEFFLSCYDAGARDFLIKPVPSPYLISRVLLALDETRLRAQLEQRDMVLKELSVIGKDSEVFTTEYLIKFLKREFDRVGSDPEKPLSMLLMQLEGLEGHPAMQNPFFRKKLFNDVATALKTCSRGTDIIGEFFESKFAIILPETALDGAEVVAQRLNRQLSGQVVEFGGDGVALKIAVGVSDKAGCMHYEDLLNKAGESLKKARQNALKMTMP